MKGIEIEKLVRKHILPELPNWEVRRSVMFVKPIGLYFSGIGFGTSGFDSEIVYAEAFVSPLYLQPRESTYSSIMRLHRAEGLDLPDNSALMKNVLVAIKSQGIPFIEALNHPEKFASGLTRREPRPSAYELEAISMSFLLLEDETKAKEALQLAINGLLKDGRKWCLEMAERLRSLFDRMDYDPQLFRRELLTWRKENLNKRHLSEFSDKALEVNT